MTTNVATKAPEIEIRVKYIHPETNQSGSLGVLRESGEPVEAYRSQYGIKTRFLDVTDPATGTKLKAFRPIEHEQLRYIRDEVGIRDGQVCVATFRAIPMGGRMVWKFLSIRPA
jgi:hypothetical protein